MLADHFIPVYLGALETALDYLEHDYYQQEVWVMLVVLEKDSSQCCVYLLYAPSDAYCSLFRISSSYFVCICPLA